MLDKISKLISIRGYLSFISGNRAVVKSSKAVQELSTKILEIDNYIISNCKDLKLEDPVVQPQAVADTTVQSFDSSKFTDTVISFDGPVQIVETPPTEAKKVRKPVFRRVVD